MSAPARPPAAAWAAWLATCLIWGTTYLAIRVALETFPVMLLAGLRWLAAGIVLGVIAMATGRTLPAPARWPSLALLGFLMNVVGNGFVVWAEQHVASGLAAVVVASVPFWTVTIEGMAPGGERPRAATMAGLAIGFLGIVVLVWPQVTMGGQEGRAVIAGVVALQIACAGWALGTSYSKRHPSTGDPIAASTIQMVASGVMLVVLGSATGEWSALTFSTRSVGAMVYLTVFGSIVAYTSYLYAIAHLPISTVSLYAYINPLIAVMLGTLLLAEPFSLRIVVAAGLVLAGIAVVRGVQSERDSPAEARRVDR